MRSHEFNTPNPIQKRADLSRFLALEGEPASWRSRRMAALVNTGPWKTALDRYLAGGFQLTGRYGDFYVMIRDPK